MPLLIGPDGHRLSKRHASLSIAELRAAGKRSVDIIGYLAYLAGLIPGTEAVQPRDLVGLLDLQRLPKGTVLVDPASLA